MVIVWYGLYVRECVSDSCMFTLEKSTASQKYWILVWKPCTWNEILILFYVYEKPIRVTDSVLISIDFSERRHRLPSGIIESEQHKGVST